MLRHDSDKSVVWTSGVQFPARVKMEIFSGGIPPLPNTSSWPHA